MLMLDELILINKEQFEKLRFGLDVRQDNNTNIIHLWSTLRVFACYPKEHVY